jgi:hypothetical protein
MKSKTPEKLEKLFPNDYWLLVPWRFYAWHPHHTSRDRSHFLHMILFINNTKNTFYETKVWKTKHFWNISIMLYWFPTGHSDQCHWEVYRSNTRFTGRGMSDRCNIMVNQIKTPIQNYFEKVLYENLTFEIPPLWFLYARL